jgi:hypothetical protein
MKFASRLVLAVLVLLPVPSPAQGPADLFKTGRVRLAAELRTADDAFPEGVLFQNPRCLAVDAGGAVYISDFDANHIKVFGPDGKFRTTLSRAGQGPGDLQWPSQIAVSGDRIVIWEAMNRRFTVLDLKGKLVKNAPAVHGGMGDIFLLGALPGGRWVACVDRGLPEGFQGRLPAERDQAVLILSADLTPVATAFESKIRNRVWTRHPQTQGLIQVGFPYHPGLRCAVSPDGTIAVGLAGSYEITLLDPDGRTRATIKRAYTPIKLENRDKEAHFASFRMNVFVDNKKTIVNQAPDYIRRLTEFPESLPPYRGFSYDGRGRLWVQVYTPERALNVFDVFSSKGEYLNRVTLEGADIDAAFTSAYEKAWAGDFLWRIEKDGDGYATLVKYRLTPAAK